MTEKQAYKLGFLLRCAELGENSAGVERLARRASLMRKEAWLGGLLGGSLGVAGDLGIKLPLFAGLTSLAAGVGTGYVGGKTLAKMTNPSYKAEQVNEDELIDAYNEYAAMMEARNRDRREGSSTT